LTVDRKDFGCYVLRRGTRYGTANTQRTTAEVVIRNDYPKAETLLAQLKAWAFQERSSATIAFFGSENAPWAVVGALLGVMTYGDAQTRTLNTVVSSVSCDCSNARWTVTTDLPVMPAGASGGGGGGVSQTIGGTQHRAIEKLRAQVDTIKREDQGRIIVAGTPLAGGGGIDAPLYLNSVVGTSEWWTDGTYSFTGILYDAADIPDELPEADPLDVVTFPSNLGRAALPGTSTWVYVATAFDLDGTIYNENPGNILNGSAIFCSTSIDAPVLGGGTAPVYIIVSP
jgi:hypothetical protein